MRSVEGKKYNNSTTGLAWLDLICWSLDLIIAEEWRISGWFLSLSSFWANTHWDIQFKLNHPSQHIISLLHHHTTANIAAYLSNSNRFPYVESFAKYYLFFPIFKFDFWLQTNLLTVELSRDVSWSRSLKVKTWSLQNAVRGLPYLLVDVPISPALYRPEVFR